MSGHLQGTPSLVMPQSSCEERAAALLTRLAALRDICSMGVSGHGCTASDGSQGVCVASEQCPDVGQPERCLGDATCCSSLTCAAGGRCVGEGRCEGRIIAGECNDGSSVCCQPLQGAAGACSQDNDCTSNQCAPGDEAPIPTPGGFCEAECDDTSTCETGSMCLASGERSLCFSTCDLNAPCRDGWRCGLRQLTAHGAEGGPMSVQVCLTDCRGQGCGAHGVCGQETGLCEKPAEVLAECPYPCEVDEACFGGRCLRADGTCASDYNCDVNWRCDAGQCTTGSFAACDIDTLGSCSDGQICVPTNDDMGVCLLACQEDEACPVNMACQPILGGDRPSVCYYGFCGEGELNGPCPLGEHSGTCRPLGAQNAAIGICLEAGRALVGSECDDQAERGNDGASPLICQPGSLCVGDEDDPLDPNGINEGRGVCRALCTVGGFDCELGERCIQYGRSDDPATPVDESFNMGLCTPTDCQIGGLDCPNNGICEPASLGSVYGRCQPRGSRDLGEPCERTSDCMASAICGSTGGITTCLKLCNPDATTCPWGQSCRAYNGGPIHTCL